MLPDQTETRALLAWLLQASRQACAPGDPLRRLERWREASDAYQRALGLAVNRHASFSLRGLRSGIPEVRQKRIVPASHGTASLASSDRALSLPRTSTADTE